MLANPHFGAIVTESGVGYTWAENAHEFRLTPWHNDPVTDASGEAIYLRDEDTGRFWSPSPLPAPSANAYVSRHGFGYSVFEHDAGGIHSEMTVFVALEAPVKFTVVKLRNDSSLPRRLSVTGYAEWVLGDLRSRDGHARHDRGRPGDRCVVRTQCLQRRISATGRVLRRRRPGAQRDRRSHRVHRSQRLLAATGRDDPRALVGESRRGARPVCGDAGEHRPAARTGARGRLPDGRGTRQRRGPHAT